MSSLLGALSVAGGLEVGLRQLGVKCCYLPRAGRSAGSACARPPETGDRGPSFFLSLGAAGGAGLGGLTASGGSRPEEMGGWGAGVGGADSLQKRSGATLEPRGHQERRCAGREPGLGATVTPP